MTFRTTEFRASIEAIVTRIKGNKTATWEIKEGDITEKIGPYQMRTLTILGEVFTMMISTRATTK
jgi:hypothetical protein